VPNQSFYWHFLYDELSRFMNGEERLRLLQACGKTVAFFGNFNDPDSNAMMPPTTRLQGVLPYGPKLAESFRRTRVTIDVANAAFINGFSVKLVDCFAAGGFALTNRKSDLTRAFGKLADQISYDAGDELAAKVDFFLTHDGQRRELADDIAEIVRQNYSVDALFARTVPLALDRLRRSARTRFLRRMRSVLTDRSRSVVRALATANLTQMAAAENWIGASVICRSSALVQTTSAPWGYSALLPLADLRRTRQAFAGTLFWEIEAEVRQGDVGIGLIEGASLVAERVIDVIDGRRTVYLPADVADADLMVRNGRNHGSSRVVIYRVRLVQIKHCDARALTPS
jgi:hypothetical protein